MNIVTCYRKEVSYCKHIEPGMGSRQFFSRQRQRSRQSGRGRGEAAMSLTEARQGRGRGELEAEARQTKFEARPRRGGVKSTLFVSF